MLRLDLHFAGETTPIEVDTTSLNITISTVQNSTDDIITVNLLTNSAGLLTKGIKVNEIVGKLLFFFFTYEGKLFLGVFHSPISNLYLLHLLTKEGNDLNEISGNYSGLYSSINTFEEFGRILDGTNKFSITGDKLEKVANGEYIKGTFPSKCTIRV